MDSLNDIANRARVLAIFAPDSSSNYLRELEGLKICRQHEDMAQFVDSSRHAVRSYLENCDQARGLFHELTVLVYQHLPEVLPLEFVRIGPSWRFDDPATDWSAIVAELRRIEDAAIRKLLAPPELPLPATPDLTPVQDAIFRVLSDEYQSAVDIATTAGCDPDNCRRELANLKRFGFVDHKSRVGYRRANARAV